MLLVHDVWTTVCVRMTLTTMMWCAELMMMRVIGRCHRVHTRLLHVTPLAELAWVCR